MNGMKEYMGSEMSANILDGEHYNKLYNRIQELIKESKELSNHGYSFPNNIKIRNFLYNILYNLNNREFRKMLFDCNLNTNCIDVYKQLNRPGHLVCEALRILNSEYDTY